MFCPNCGKKIPKNTNFCPFCGHVINVNNSVQQHKPNVVPHLHHKNKPDYHNPRFYNEYNPKKITKKAKILLAGIFAVAVIGGITHHVYKNSPAGINLEKQINNHVYETKGLSDMLPGNSSDSEYITGHKDASLFNAGRYFSDEISFDNGELMPYDNNENPESDEDNIDYSVGKNILTISDGTTVGGSDTPANNNDSDTSNYLKFKVHKVADNGKKITLYPIKYSSKDVHGGKVQNVTSNRRKRNRIILKEVRKLNS